MKNGLNIFSKWIEKLPDGSRPSQLLKKKVVELLNLIQFDNYVEMNKELGRFLAAISQNVSKCENIEIQAMARAIIDRWSRVLSNNKISYGTT